MRGQAAAVQGRHTEARIRLCAAGEARLGVSCAAGHCHIQCHAAPVWASASSPFSLHSSTSSTAAPGPAAAPPAGAGHQGSSWTPKHSPGQRQQPMARRLRRPCHAQQGGLAGPQFQGPLRAVQGGRQPAALQRRDGLWQLAHRPWPSSPRTGAPFRLADAARLSFAPCASPSPAAASPNGGRERGRAAQPGQNRAGIAATRRLGAARRPWHRSPAQPPPPGLCRHGQVPSAQLSA